MPFCRKANIFLNSVKCTWVRTVTIPPENIATTTILYLSGVEIRRVRNVNVLDCPNLQSCHIKNVQQQIECCNIALNKEILEAKLQRNEKQAP
jgi:hypothetical protein